MLTKHLLKALTEAGAGSRRRLADAIRQGRVEINGEIAEDFRHPVNLATDQVTIDRKPVDLSPGEIICLMLHKPKGVLSTTHDERGRPTVMDILPQEYRHLRLYPAGRLDKDSTGLLLLTNDGQLIYRLTHPRFEHEKEYLIHIDGNLKPDEKRKLEQGISLKDGMTYPAKITEVKSSPPFNYSVIIHEGRKRQVRRMFNSLGHPVLALKRVRIGNLTLSSLKEGDVKRLSTERISMLLND